MADPHFAMIIMTITMTIGDTNAEDIDDRIFQVSASAYHISVLFLKTDRSMCHRNIYK